MNTEQKLKALAVGDRVYVGQGGWSKNRYTTAVISKITDTGLIDVLIGLSPKPTRFNSNGRERGSRYGGYWIATDMSFDERTADLAMEEKLSEVAAAILLVTPERVNANWEYYGLSKEIDRLRGLLDAAAAKLAEISHTAASGNNSPDDTLSA